MQTGVLTQPALVLNRSWVAVATTPVKRAVQLLFTGAARAVRPETFEVHDFESWADLSVARDKPHIRTVSLRIPVPEVIVLSHFDGVPRHGLAFTRRNLYRRDGNTCQYCGARPGTEELSIDHILPRSRGGLSTWENCVLACTRCNKRKANRLPREAGMKLLHEPRQPRWAPFLEVPLARRKESWERFVSERYWNVALET